MKYEFTEMHGEGWPEFAGEVTFYAENSTDVVTLNNRYKIFDTNTPEGAIAYAKALTEGNLLHHDGGKPNGNSGPYVWFESSVALGTEWFDPYAQAMERATGTPATEFYIADKLPLPFLDELGYGSFRSDSYLLHGSICSTVLSTAASHDKAQAYAAKSLQRMAGVTRENPEFIPTANGQYQRNPKYATEYEVIDCKVGSKDLMEVVIDWWRRTKATPEQLAILEASEALHPGYGGLKPSYSGGLSYSLPCSIYYLDPKGACDYDGKGKMASVISIGDFAKLGSGVA